MTWSCDKNLRWFERKNDKRFVMGITIESTVKFAEVAWTYKSITLLCVSRRMNQAYLNFKHQFHNMTYRLSL